MFIQKWVEQVLSSALDRISDLLTFDPFKNHKLVFYIVGVIFAVFFVYQVFCNHVLVLRQSVVFSWMRLEDQLQRQYDTTPMEERALLRGDLTLNDRVVLSTRLYRAILALQDSSVEDQRLLTEQFAYNTHVLHYNRTLARFPYNILARFQNWNKINLFNYTNSSQPQFQ